MHYATLRRLSAYEDAQLRYILVDATAAYDCAVHIGGTPEAEAKYLAEIAAVAHVLQTRALTRIPK